MAARQKNPDQLKMTAPRGVLKYPKLNEPDHGTDAFPCSHAWGDYKTRLILDRSDKGVEAFLAKLDKHLARSLELAEEAFKELPVKRRKELEADGGIRADAPYSVIYDEETEEDTGKVELNFKMRAGGERKKDGKEWTAKPDLFDAKLKPLGKKTAVWSGSTAIIVFESTPYFMPGTGKYGITRRLNAAQIVELVSAGGNKSASSYGFGEQDGYDSSQDADEDDAREEDGDTSEGGDEPEVNF